MRSLCLPGAIALVAACGTAPPSTPDVAGPRPADALSIAAPCVPAPDAAVSASPVAVAKPAPVGLDCDHVRDADLLELRACALATNDAPKDGDAPPDGLYVAVTPHPATVKVGGRFEAVVRIVNGGPLPVRVAFVPEDVGVGHLDGRHVDVDVPRGKCMTGGRVLNLGEVTITPIVRVTLEPGGSVHHTFGWDAVGYRWSAPPKGGGLCHPVADGPLTAGTYYAETSLPTFKNYSAESAPTTTVQASFEITR